MKLLTLAAAISLALVAGCDRNNPTPGPSPKADAGSVSSASPAAAGASASASRPVTESANDGAGNREDDRNGANPQNEQIDPNHASQRRDFQQSGDQAGPQSAAAAPNVRNGR